MRRFLFAMSLWLIGSTPVWAADDKKAAAKDEEEEEDGGEDEEDEKDDKDEPAKPVHMKIPSLLRGHGYTLRIDETEHSLDKEEIVVPPNDYLQPLEVQKNGRILVARSGYLDEDILATMKPREWHVGLFLGGTTINGDAFESLLQDSHLTEISLDAAWQPEAWGLEMQLAGLSSDEEQDDGIYSSYSSSQLRLNGIYEIAPFSSGSSTIRKLHLVGRAGVFTASHSIKIYDDVVTLSDETSSGGALVGLDALYVINNFWFGLRGYYSYQEVEFDKFDFKSQVVQRSLQIGGNYAF